MTGMLQTNSYMACSWKAAEFIHKCWILIILFEINYPQKKIIIKLQFDTNYFSKTNPTEVWWEYLVAKSQLSCKITVSACIQTWCKFFRKSVSLYLFYNYFRTLITLHRIYTSTRVTSLFQGTLPLTWSNSVLVYICTHQIQYYM